MPLYSPAPGETAADRNFSWRWAIPHKNLSFPSSSLFSTPSASPQGLTVNHWDAWVTTSVLKWGSSWTRKGFGSNAVGAERSHSTAVTRSKSSFLKEIEKAGVEKWEEMHNTLFSKKHRHRYWDAVNASPPLHSGEWISLSLEDEIFRFEGSTSPSRIRACHTHMGGRESQTAATSQLCRQKSCSPMFLSNFAPYSGLLPRILPFINDFSSLEALAKDLCI